MIVPGRSGAARADRHTGYIAGRYRDGARSDTWTDVVRCAPGTFVSYVPACSCGWFGRDRPATAAGFRSCQRDLVSEHLGVPDPPLPSPEQPAGRVRRDLPEVCCPAGSRGHGVR